MAAAGSALWILFVVCAGVGGYLGSNWWQSARPHPPVGPALGEPLPSTPVRSVDVKAAPVEYLEKLATAGNRCALVVLASMSCHYCQLMRLTWSARARSWADSVGREVNFIWLAGDDVTEQQSFYSGFDFAGVVLRTVVGEPGRALGRLGLFGTPTTYLLDREGLLREGVMGDRLPSVSAGMAACK